MINATGNSMSPTIENGDKLIVEHWNSNQIQDNRIYVFCYNNEFFVKSKDSFFIKIEICAESRYNIVVEVKLSAAGNRIGARNRIQDGNDMTFEHDVCPICAQPFAPSDDVVVCPDCGTPHHRGCWMQLGGCANADKHGQDFVWQSAAPKETAAEADAAYSTRCPRCGEECAPDALICPTCGKKLGVATDSRFDFNDDFFLRGVDADPETDLDGFSVREAAMFVQYRAGDYVRKFSRIKAGKKAGWNWAAFFFSPFWFFYRKIRKAGALFLGIVLVLAVFLAIPLQKVQQQALSTVREYVTIDENTTADQVVSAIAALEETQQQKVQAAVLRYSRAILIYMAALFLPNFAAAIVADSLYKKKSRRTCSPYGSLPKTRRRCACSRCVAAACPCWD